MPELPTREEWANMTDEEVSEFTRQCAAARSRRRVRHLQQLAERYEHYDGSRGDAEERLIEDMWGVMGGQF